MAAACVALFHFNVIHPAEPDLYHRVLSLGGIGVPAFFVISGYCIAHARLRDAIVPFWARRLVRIYPPLWGSIALITAIVGYRYLYAGVNDVTVLPKDFPSILYTITGLTTPASTVRGMNWVYWSLGYEIAFYIIVGILMIRGQALALVVFSLAALSARNFGYPFEQWGLFSLGISACFLVQRRFAAGWTLFAISTIHIATTQWRGEIAAALVTFLLIIFPPRLCAHPSCAPLRWTGRVSYSLYLIHVPIGCHVVARIIDPWIPANLLCWVGRDSLILALCFLAAALFHSWIEAPSHRVARQMFRFEGSRRSPRGMLETAGPTREVVSLGNSR